MNWDQVREQGIPVQPAAGANFSYTVPVGKKGLLMGLMGALTTGIGAARNVHFEITNKIGCPWSATNLFANQSMFTTQSYMILPGVAYSDAVDQARRTAPLPRYMELPAGSVFTLLTYGIMPTDQWVIRWLYKETKA